MISYNCPLTPAIAGSHMREIGREAILVLDDMRVTGLQAEIDRHV